MTDLAKDQNLFETDVGEEPCAIRLLGVSKRLGAAEALRDVSFQAPRGSCCLLAGANGAGKSTLLRIIQGLLRPDQGRAETLGLDPVRHAAVVRANVGYLPEGINLGNRGLKVGWLLHHHRAYYRSWDAPYADHLLRRLDIPTDRLLGQLSKGESRRVQLLMALAHRPALLLLDEPTDGLDPIVRDEVFAVLSEYLSDTGCTALIATHLVHEVQGLADRVALLKSGGLVTQTSRERMSRKLKRYRGVPGAGWSPPPELEGRIVATDQFGRERRWTIAGEEGAMLAALKRSGVEIADVAPLSLDEAVLALLRPEKQG